MVVLETMHRDWLIKMEPASKCLDWFSQCYDFGQITNKHRERERGCLSVWGCTDKQIRDNELERGRYRPYQGCRCGVVGGRTAKG